MTPDTNDMMIVVAQRIAQMMARGTKMGLTFIDNFASIGS
jgi:hypothetical protein